MKNLPQGTFQETYGRHILHKRLFYPSEACAPQVLVLLMIQLINKLMKIQPTRYYRTKNMID